MGTVYPGSFCVSALRVHSSTHFYGRPGQFWFINSPECGSFFRPNETRLWLQDCVLVTYEWKKNKEKSFLVIISVTIQI